MKYTMVRVRATFAGQGEGNPGLDITASIVGDDQQEYSDPDCDAVQPDPMWNKPSVLAGGTVEGNFCVLIPVELGNPLVSLSAEASDDVWWLAA